VPMAITLDDLHAIVAAQRRTGLTYMMMETAVFTREFLYAQSLMQAGQFGTISIAKGSHLQDMEGWPDYWMGLPPQFYMVVSRMWWKFSCGDLRALGFGPDQATRSRVIGSMG